jgi:fibronectin-binding autotransporter adhesin
MKMSASSKSPVLLTGLRNALLVGIVLANSSRAHATSYTWNGTGNSNATTGWGTSTDWTANGIPGSGDTITFNGTGATTATVTLGGSQAIGGISISTGATGSTAITSGGTAGFTLTIGTGGITQAASTGAVTLGSATPASNFTIVLGGNQTWANSSSSSMTVNAGINGNSAVTTNTLSATGNMVLAGPIGDTTTPGDNVALNWNSAGSLTLSGTNAYTGGTTVAGTGTIFLNTATAFGAGAININGGAFDNTSSGVLTLTNNNAININGSFTAASTNHSFNFGTGNVTLGGTNTAYTITANGFTTTLGGTVTGGSGDGIVMNGSGNLFLTGAVNLTNGTLAASSGILQLGNGTTGALTGVATVAITGASTFLQFDLANSGVYTGAITNSSTSTVVGNPISGNVQTLSGNISGSTAKFEQNGSGTTILSGSNSYGGGTNLNLGTLNLASANAIGTTGTISFTGGTLQYSASNTTDYSSRFSNAASQAYSIDTNGQTVNAGSNLTSSGGTLTKLGAGTLIVSGANTFSGGTTITGGTLQMGSSGALGATTGSLADNATLDLNGNSLTVGALSGSGTITSSAAGSLTVATGGSSSTTFSGVILNGSATSVALTMNSTGTLSMTGASGSTYSGGTTINGGTVYIGTGPSTFPANNTMFTTLGTGTVTVNSGGTLALGNVGSTTNTYYLGSATADSGNAINLNGGSLVSFDGIENVSGTVNVTAASVLGGSFTGKGLYLNGDLTGSGNLTVQNSGLTVGTNTFNTSAVHLTSTDSATANSYSGTITITPGTAGGSATAAKAGDYLSIDGSTILSNATVNLSGNNANAGAYGTQTLLFGKTAVTIGALIGSGNTVLSETFNGSSAVALSLGNNGATTDTYSGALSGTGSLIKIGTDTLVLSGSNAYTGVTTISAGQLTLSGTLGSSGGTAITSSATLSETSAGVIAGTSSLNVTAGTTTLNGSNTYSGTTAVSGTGTLVIGSAATSTETGGTSVGFGGTLQLQNVNALQYSALTLSNGSTLQLRANTATNGTTTTFVPASIAAMSGNTALTIDVGNISTGTANTVALTGTLAFGANTSNQINVTNSTVNTVGGTSSGLALGAITNQGTANGTYNFIINATTAPVSITSFLASSFGTNLILEGGNNITFGSSSTPTGTTTLSSSSNGYFNTTVSGANVTIYGTYVTSGTGAHTLTLTSGELNLDSTAASGGQNLNLAGGTLDNTSGGALTESGNPFTTISNSFIFAGSSSLNLGTGGASVTGNATATINANTLTIGGTTTINAGDTLTKAGSGTLTLGATSVSGGGLADTGSGTFNTGNITFFGTGNTVSNAGTGVMALGTITNLSGTSIGSADFTPAATPTNLTSSGTNGSGNSTIISVMDTVNGGADFAAIGTGGAIVARNSIVAETALPASGSSSSLVYFLTGSQSLTTATETVAALRINDTNTSDVLNVGTVGLTLGGNGNSGLMYNGGTNGVYTISGTGYVGDGSGHSFYINTYAGTLIISAPLIDAGGGASFDSLYKGGAGTLVLTGANTFGGSNANLIVGGGTLDLGNGNTGSFSGTFGTGPTVDAGATLGIGLANGSTVAASINNNGTISLNELTGVTNTISGSVAGQGNLVQNGAGTTILTGASVSPFLTGGVTINAGALQIANAGALGATLANHQTSGVLVNSGGALQISGGISTTGAYATTLNGAGVTTAPKGALESVSGTNTYTGAITLGSAASIGADASSTLILSGNVANGGNTLTVLGAGSTTLAGVISGSGGLTSASTATTTLSGGTANTYTGETIVSAGELDLNKSANIVAIQGLGANTVLTAPDILVNGGTLKFMASNQFPQVGSEVTLSMTSGTVSLNNTSQTVYAFANSGGTFTTGSGTLTGTGATTTFSGGTNTINSGGQVEDSHFVISGGTNTVQAGGTMLLDGGGAGIEFSNGANLTLNSDNTSPGQLNLVAFGSSFAISSSAASTTATISSGSGGSQAGTINLSSNELDFTNAAGTVAAGGPDMSISAVIADGSGGGGGSITKSGNGILQLTAVNTYTGPTSVFAGTLNVTGSIANSTVAVSNGAFLNGTGTTGAVSLAGGASINLQNGLIGTLTVGGLSMGNATTASALTFDIGSTLGTVDSIKDTSFLTMSGINGTTITIGNATGVSSLTDGLYNIITYTGTESGSLADLSLLTTSLDGKVLTLVQGSGAIELMVADGVTPLASGYFNGQGTDLNTAANYDTSVSNGTAAISAPTRTANVFFSANRNTSSTANVSAALAVNSLGFGTGTGTSNETITASGTGSITIEATSANGNTAGNGITVSSGSDTISAPVVLGASQTWTESGSSSLTQSGVVSDGSNGYALTKAGTGTLVLSNASGNTYSGGTTVSAGTLLASNTSGSATGTGSLTVSGGATIGGYGLSSGTSFSISGTGTATGARANVLVGMNSAGDTNTTHVLALIGSATSTITNANLTFNISAGTAGALGSNPSGSGTELAVGSTAVGFGTGVASVTLTLNVQNEPGIITAYTPYVLVAGTVASGGTGVNGSQYSGLSLGAVLQSGSGFTETLITGTNLQLAFGSSVDSSYYANSYLVLYQNTNTGVDDIDVVVVPEPGTWALMLGGLALLVTIQRRRNKQGQTPQRARSFRSPATRQH